MLNGCIEKYDDLQVSKEPILVIDAFISDVNDSVYRLCGGSETHRSYVRLSLSQSLTSTELDDSMLITDALVIIKDDIGNIDTLRNPDDPLFNRPFIDSPKKVFRLQKLYPHAGHSYYLEVYYNNKLYTASTFMPLLPKVDSLHFIYTSIPSNNPIEKVRVTSIVPRVFFIDPPGEENFYLFKFYDGVPYSGWKANVLSDKYLVYTTNKGIDGFFNNNVTTGFIGYTHFLSNQVILFFGAINKEAYDYLYILHGLYRTDGGNFSPTPASVHGNISGGALGFFYAASSFVVPRINLPYPKDGQNTPEGANLMTLFPDGTLKYTKYGF